MIVDSFSEEEYLAEIKKDFENVLKISDNREPKVRRLALKSSKFPIYPYCYVTSPLKNRWLILWEITGRKNTGEESLVYFMLIKNTTNGREVYMPNFVNGKLILLLFLPHLFSRFAKRSGIDLTGEDLIKRFFEQNSSFGFSEKTVPISEKSAYTEVYGSTKEGVCLGLKSVSNNIIALKTFVTYDMLKGGQIERLAATEKIRKEIHG